MILIPPRKDPVEDKEKTSLSFTDVLFAIVVGKTLDLMAQPDTPRSGMAQLVLTLITTLLSYVGYRNSLNRRGYLLRPLCNIPFWQFVIDVTLVVLYFRMATTSESAASPTPSAAPEAIATAIVFGLYVGWDMLASAMRGDERYASEPGQGDVAPRYHVTRVACAVAVVILGVVLVRQPGTTASVIVADVALVTLMILYRYAKELVVLDGHRLDQDTGAPS